jgi:hypothetical protein
MLTIKDALRDLGWNGWIRLTWTCLLVSKSVEGWRLDIPILIWITFAYSSAPFRSVRGRRTRVPGAIGDLFRVYLQRLFLFIFSKRPKLVWWHVEMVVVWCGCMYRIRSSVDRIQSSVDRIRRILRWGDKDVCIKGWKEENERDALFCLCIYIRVRVEMNQLVVVGCSWM